MIVEYIVGGILAFIFYALAGITLANSITESNGPWGYDAHRWFRGTSKGRLTTFLIGLLWPVVIGLIFAAIALALPLAIIVGPYYIYKWIRFGE